MEDPVKWSKYFIALPWSETERQKIENNMYLNFDYNI